MAPVALFQQKIDRGDIILNRRHPLPLNVVHVGELGLVFRRRHALNNLVSWGGFFIAVHMADVVLVMTAIQETEDLGMGDSDT